MERRIMQTTIINGVVVRAPQGVVVREVAPQSNAVANQAAEQTEDGPVRRNPGEVRSTSGLPGFNSEVVFQKWCCFELSAWM